MPLAASVGGGCRGCRHDERTMSAVAKKVALVVAGALGGLLASATAGTFVALMLPSSIRNVLTIAMVHLLFVAAGVGGGLLAARTIR